MRYIKNKKRRRIRLKQRCRFKRIYLPLINAVMPDIRALFNEPDDGLILDRPAPLVLTDADIIEESRRRNPHMLEFFSWETVVFPSMDDDTRRALEQLDASLGVIR